MIGKIPTGELTVIETVQLPDEYGGCHVPVLGWKPMYDKKSGTQWIVYLLANSSPNAVIDTGAELRWVNIEIEEDE